MVPQTIMHFLKKAKSVVITAIAMLMCSPTGVYADDVTYATTDAIIDETKTGSITLFKYIDNDGKTVDASGIKYTGNESDMLAAVRTEVGNTDIFPEKGVHFKAVKIADIDQITEDTGGGINVTGTYYTNIDSGFMKLVRDYLGNTALVPSEATRRTDGRLNNDTANLDDHYESDDLNTVIMNLNRATATTSGSAVTGEVALNRYLRQNPSAKAFPITNENGYTSLDGLQLGLYLICETDFEHSALSKHDTYWELVNDGINDPLQNGTGSTEDANRNSGSGMQTAGVDGGGSAYADIASPASPFLISIPMTNIADITGEDGVLHRAGTVWQYDVYAYPKASTINIHKDIVTDNFTGTTVGGTADDGLYGNDGNDLAHTKTLCSFVQTNYQPDNGTPDMIDGDYKYALTHQIDANIGDIVTHLISADVPALVDDLDNEQPDNQANSVTQTRKHNKTFIITDRMTKGLKLIDTQSFKVTLSTSAWNNYANSVCQQFVYGADYTVDIAADKQSFVLTVTPAGLAKMDDIDSASYLYVLYDTEVTKDALIGTDTYSNQRVTVKTTASTENQQTSGALNDSLVIDNTKSDVTYVNENGVSHPEATNQNTAKLTYATDRTQEHQYYSNTVSVFTYEIDLTKTFTDGTAGGGQISTNAANTANNGSKNTNSFNYSQVKFTIRGSVNPASADAAGANADIGSTDWEQMYFIRTGDGTYRVWDSFTDGGRYVKDEDLLDQAADQKTITKYVTPNSETGLLTLKGLDARTYEFTEVATATGRNLMAEKFYAELVAPVVSGKTLENGQLEHVYIWTGNKPATSELSGYDLASYSATFSRMEQGRAPFTLQNNEIIKVLKTGGAGTYVIFGVGAVIVVGGVVLLLKRKKDKEESEKSE